MSSKTMLWSGAPYEYSRTADGLVFTAGACPLDLNGNVVAPGDLEAQARQAVDNLVAALADAGASPDSLLRTTVYVATQTRAELALVWQVVATRLGRTPSTLLGVACLGYPEQLVEIEAIAAMKPASRG
jgi:enamine deaminase RidA (YjgF/YER057c/UK114 family)